MSEVIIEHKEQINFAREGVKIGLINAAIALLFLFGSYFMGFKTFFDVQFYEKFIPYMFVILVLRGLQIKKNNGGFLSFKEGMQYAFMSFVIATVIMAIANYILYNLVDPTLTEKTFQAGIEKTRNTLEKLGTPQNEIDDTINKFSKEKKDTSIGRIFLGAGWSLIICFMESLLISLIIRKEKPQPTS